MIEGNIFIIMFFYWRVGGGGILVFFFGLCFLFRDVLWIFGFKGILLVLGFFVLGVEFG